MMRKNKRKESIGENMKIAAFGTFWNEEILHYYLGGFRSWAEDHDAIVDLFVCYGRIGIEDKDNWGEYRIFDLPDFQEYDGAILIDSTINEPSVRDNLYHKIKKADIPCVTIDNQVEGFSSIGVDQQYHMKKLVEHLIHKHHASKLCYIGAPIESVEADARLQGFLLALEENHIKLRPEWIYTKSYAYKDGMDVVEELLASEELPDAIVCANDDMASGVCDRLIAAGLMVGEEVLVTGFDNYFLGENYSPRLTTVRRPRESMTYRACDMIMTQIEHGRKVQHVYQQANIALGETCGCRRELCGDHREFRRIMFQREQNSSYINKLLTVMDEKIRLGEGIETVMANVGEMITTLGIARCLISLTPDVDDPEQYIHTSYRDCSNVCFLYADDSVDHKVRIEGHAYIYTPIHYMEHLYGYCIFLGADPLMADGQLHQFLKNMGSAIENVVEKKKYQLLNSKLEHLYETDSLTGTYNRHGMEKFAEKFFQENKKNQIPTDIIFVDIDYLKRINDTYGHETGDYTIQTIGHALLSFQNEHCKVFRFGGDEFIVLRRSKEDFQIFTKQLKEKIITLQKGRKQPFQVSASVGCVTAFPEDDIDLRTYIRKADKEMYQIKKELHSI